MTDNIHIHIHRLRRAWETSDGVRCTMAIVYTKDLRHAIRSRPEERQYFIGLQW